MCQSQLISRISSIITDFDYCIDIHKDANSDLDQDAVFQTVAHQLPILRNALLEWHEQKQQRDIEGRQRNIR